MSIPKVAARSGASEAQVRANRANSLKSTGPKSVAGKARASQNAISHGFFSRKVVLPGENPQEFELLRQGLIAEHQPRTITEQFLVERMAISMWRLNRLQEVEAEAHEDVRVVVSQTLSKQEAVRQQTVPATTIRILAGAIGQSVLEKLEMYEKRLEGTLHRSIRELRKMRETKSDETKPISGEAEPTEDMANTEVMDESVVSVADAETEGPALDRAAQPGRCEPGEPVSSSPVNSKKLSRSQ
jgi:hypothetical protein